MPLSMTSGRRASLSNSGGNSSTTSNNVSISPTSLKQAIAQRRSSLTGGGGINNNNNGTSHRRSSLSNFIHHHHHVPSSSASTASTATSNSVKSAPASPRNNKSRNGIASRQRRLTSSKGLPLVSLSTGPREWNETERQIAINVVLEHLTEQMELQRDMEKLMERTQEYVMARLESLNQIGAVLSMKQVLKYEAQRDHATIAIAKLEQLLNKVRESTTDVRYEAKIEKVLAAPHKYDLDPNHNIAEDAKQRLQSLLHPGATTVATTS